MPKWYIIGNYQQQQRLQAVWITPDLPELRENQRVLCEAPDEFTARDQMMVYDLVLYEVEGD